MVYKKTVQEKLETKLKAINNFEKIERRRNKFTINREVYLEIVDNTMIYGKKRFFPNLTDPIKEEAFAVTIVLNHENLNCINSNPINPPKGAKKVFDVFKNITGLEINRILIGTTINSIDDGVISITKSLYDYIQGVDREERQEKNVRVFNRMIPLLSNDFGVNTDEFENERDYSLLLQEIIASGEITQEDLMKLAENLEVGQRSKVIIEKHVVKQVEWLVGEIEEILSIEKLTRKLAKDIGHGKFGYTKMSVTGPEHLMEKILTDFGQYSLFGVPALLNTGKFIIHEGSSRSQIDLILINHLGDIELVELKRPDECVFEYGNSRGKFYPSKNLSIAISQLERYITAVHKDNDEQYLIEGEKIRDFIIDEVGM